MAAMISFITCIWQGVTNSWQHLLVARVFLGLGLGPKSATVPVYGAECAPPLIRGGLVMMYQIWTAFGIMFGYVMNFAFRNVPDPAGIRGLNWRLMLGSVSLYVYFMRSLMEIEHLNYIGRDPCAANCSPSILLPGISPLVHDERKIWQSVRIAAPPTAYRSSSCARPLLCV